MSELKNLKQDIKGFALSQEDVMSYALFPDVGRTFLKERKEGNLKGEILLSKAIHEQTPALTELDIVLHGESHHVKLAGFGERQGDSQSVFLWMDGVPEEVRIHYQNADFTEEKQSRMLNSSPKLKGDIYLSIPGNIVSIPGNSPKITQSPNRHQQRGLRPLEPF